MIAHSSNPRSHTDRLLECPVHLDQGLLASDDERCPLLMAAPYPVDGCLGISLTQHSAHDSVSLDQISSQTVGLRSLSAVLTVSACCGRLSTRLGDLAATDNPYNGSHRDDEASLSL
ncbi:hypothetical protein RRG08_002160 [Elysia crispata]|uniref:Uncharacterized protein n=1 Tax=Elysia crispata TaxID=231223 RepID=A0AAE1DCR6_9GAST|nr:hypothetical protein RRG08_002160 [Elysia crispata]